MKEIELERIKDVIILHLQGNNNSCKVPNFEIILKNILEGKPMAIAVDCSMLYVVDPSMISQIAKYIKKAQSNNIQIVLYNVNPEVRPTLEMMKLDGFITLVSQECLEKEYLHKNLLN